MNLLVAADMCEHDAARGTYTFERETLHVLAGKDAVLCEGLAQLMSAFARVAEGFTVRYYIRS